MVSGRAAKKKTHTVAGDECPHAPGNYFPEPWRPGFLFAPDGCLNSRDIANGSRFCAVIPNVDGEQQYNNPSRWNIGLGPCPFAPHASTLNLAFMTTSSCACAAKLRFDGPGGTAVPDAATFLRGAIKSNPGSLPLYRACRRAFGRPQEIVRSARTRRPGPCQRRPAAFFFDPSGRLHPARAKDVGRATIAVR